MPPPYTGFPLLHPLQNLYPSYYGGDMGPYQGYDPYSYNSYAQANSMHGPRLLKPRSLRSKRVSEEVEQAVRDHENAKTAAAAAKEKVEAAQKEYEEADAAMKAREKALEEAKKRERFRRGISFWS
jgi:hypothetical protein